jgi:hypothetical protein
MNRHGISEEKLKLFQKEQNRNSRTTLCNIRSKKFLKEHDNRDFRKGTVNVNINLQKENKIF